MWRMLSFSMSIGDIGFFVVRRALFVGPRCNVAQRLFSMAADFRCFDGRLMVSAWSHKHQIERPGLILQSLCSFKPARSSKALSNSRIDLT